MLCIVPDMVLSVILLDPILSRILSCILFCCAGWWVFLGCFIQALTVFGVFQFHLEAPVTCLLLYLFNCCYISKLLRLSSCSALSWPLWLVHCCIVFFPQRFSRTIFLVPSELWICIFSLYHLKTRATIKKNKFTSWSLRALSSTGSCSVLGLVVTVVWLLVSCTFLLLVLCVYLGRDGEIRPVNSYCRETN